MNEFKLNPHASKRQKEPFTCELRQIIRNKETRWAGDILGFLDAVSKIPVLILLRFEKRQLEFWRETVNPQGVSRDDAERRLCEVDSLFETRCASLVKTSDVPESHPEITLNVVTRHRLETRRRKLLENIAAKSGMPTRRIALMGREGCVTCVNDDVCDRDEPGCCESPIVGMTELSVFE